MLALETKLSGGKLLQHSDLQGGGVFPGEGTRSKQRGMKIGTWNVRSLYRAGSLKMDLQEVRSGYMDWIGLAQDRERWRTVVSAVMNLRVPWNAGNFLTSCKPVSFSRRTLHHGVSKYVYECGVLVTALCVMAFLHLAISVLCCAQNTWVDYLALKIFNTIVLPTFLYGSENWTLKVLQKTKNWSGRNEVTETSGRLHPLWPQNKWLHTPRTTDYRHTRQDRWIQTGLAFTLAKNATKPNPFDIIPL